MNYSGVARDDSVFRVFKVTRYRGLSNIRSVYMLNVTTICCGFEVVFVDILCCLGLRGCNLNAISVR